MTRRQRAHRRKAGLAALLAGLQLTACATRAPVVADKPTTREGTEQEHGSSLQSLRIPQAQPPRLASSSAPAPRRSVLRGTPAAAPSLHVVRTTLDFTGREVVLRVGETLKVTLAPGWTPPTESSTTLNPTATLYPLRTSNAVGFPDARPAAATFIAIRPGDAVISARTDFTCLHLTPTCALPQRSFTLNVHVPPLHGARGPQPAPGPS